MVGARDLRIFMPAATRNAIRTVLHSRTRAWYSYRNDGSYDGQFDWVPRHLRVGPWHHLVKLFLSAAPFLLFHSKPASDSTFTVRPGTVLFSSSHLLDVVLFLWCIAMIAVCKLRETSISGLSLSFSGWTWLLLTARCGAGTELTLALYATMFTPRAQLSSPVLTASLVLPAGALRPVLDSFDSRLSELVGVVELHLRFPVLSQAILVFVGWNLCVLPCLYFFLLKDNPRRQRDLLAYATQFGQMNLHVSVVPMAMVHTLPERGIFGAIELWHALLIWCAYMYFYCFVLDRMGMHLYAMFSPRSAHTLFAYAVMVAYYCGVFHGANLYLQLY